MKTLLMLLILLCAAAILVVPRPSPRPSSADGEWETDPEPPRKIYRDVEDPRIETPEKRAHRYADQRTYAQLGAMKQHAWDQMTTARLRGDRAALTSWNAEYNAAKAAMAIQEQRQRESDDLDARLRREASRR